MMVSVYEKLINEPRYIKHIINVDGYHQKLSYRGFFNRLRNAWYRHTRSSVYYSFIKFSENDKFNSYEKFVKHTYQHKSLWDFYEHIGYKHKNRSKQHLLTFIIIN